MLQRRRVDRLQEVKREALVAGKPKQVVVDRGHDLRAQLGVGIVLGAQFTGHSQAIGHGVGQLIAQGAALAEQGVRLLYHNHNCELQRVEGEKRGYDILLAETEPDAVNFEFDSYWFAEGGADVAAVMKTLGNRMKLWHINDRGTRLAAGKPAMTPILKTDSMELGTGNLPLEHWAAIAKENGVEAVVLESHRNWVDKDPVKSAQVSARWLHEHL